MSRETAGAGADVAQVYIKNQFKPQLEAAAAHVGRKRWKGLVLV